MKKITKTYEVYDIDQLSAKARENALREWNEENDMPFLQSILNDECGQMLKEQGITCTSNHPVCLYSLSLSQGDGLMFEGSFLWREYSIKVKHTGHYYHSNSKSLEIFKLIDGQEVEAPEQDASEFEAIYQSICKKLEKFGYEWIEDEQSEAHFIDECNANEWTFTKDGKMLNA